MDPTIHDPQTPPSPDSQPSGQDELETTVPSLGWGPKALLVLGLALVWLMLAARPALGAS
ncbi:MAG: hypothetical protein HC922_03680 [Leptolyngbyaceae cyanobacterium SM2_3_12]|nr:hypothetical protein [Leptolyngbyaceae cyanobacterium SM2_3_12]